MDKRKQKKAAKPSAQQEDWQKGEKRMRGKPIFYDEVKDCRVSATLTRTAKRELEARAKASQLSISEYLERWLRGAQSR